MSDHLLTEEFKTPNNDLKHAGLRDDLKDAIDLPKAVIHKPYEDGGVDRRKFIEEQFLIRAKDEREDKAGYTIPFKFNVVQNKYYEQLLNDYPSSDGYREIILKARQQGFSSVILALFVVDFITKPQSVSICISHRAKETKLLFKRVRFYIEAYCNKNGFNIDDYLSVDTKEELENATNKAYFYIGTAGSKVGGRGDTVTNIHFSEAAFYQETEKVDAKEIIESTVQQVPQGHGMVFIESTGGHYGSYYQGEWERAKEGTSIYKPRFFSWDEFYSKAWIEEQKKTFQSEEEFKSHYPADDAEAFLFSGNPFFNRMTLSQMDKASIDPILSGRLATDGQFI